MDKNLNTQESEAGGLWIPRQTTVQTELEASLDYAVITLEREKIGMKEGGKWKMVRGFIFQGLKDIVTSLYLIS